MGGVETKRIYDISRDKFRGVFQSAKPYTPLSFEGQSGQISFPVAVIEYENELRIVEPYQVRFIKEDKQWTTL